MFRRLFGGEEAADNLRIIITRHGERADLALGKNWLRRARRQGGHDSRISRLPRRPNFHEWEYDPPLTVAGEKQSVSVGRKLLELGYPIDYCYSSPAYRSIQTANRILESQGRRRAVPINIEPGLFEYSSWYSGAPLVFIPPEYLAMDRRFYINTGYSPIYGSVDTNENEQQFYRRSRQLLDAIVAAHKYQGGTILLSGHAASIEAITRSLRGGVARHGQYESLMHGAARVNFSNFAILERDGRTGAWSVHYPESHHSPHGRRGSSMQHTIPLHSVTTYHRASRRAGRSPRRRNASQVTHHRHDSQYQHYSQYQHPSHYQHHSHYR
ncbi:unnamed protein product [Rotaria sp. Silwood1]|nr:unnamed protein product [Rotaria sp. Silwood1]CAF0995385.1 unnamed protein product [Rotaria sp. Silwood1]CAF3406458.1 unnamed protein product [Rotaria sp. Silwood1]CAF4798821.1 unnamed protein product [Rotaria sp. Silwood1]